MCFKGQHEWQYLKKPVNQASVQRHHTYIMDLSQYRSLWWRTEKENVLHICFCKVLWVKGRTGVNYSIYESILNAVFTGPNSHKFSPSRLYGRHINAQAVLFNSCCLISSSPRIRKWKSQTQKGGNSVLFLSLLPAQCWQSFFPLSYSTCFSL